ncbi:magnesium transporter [Entomortierella parvispora]|uniref:Magnesium transporter n=1 Tax=Entomortierella parvispora TaxID=205924 RepID=A0A9P3HKX1_9FUNG|nr:magnesium transporter [Entomortierella parvispora]
MNQQGLGACQAIDQRSHVWIGVVITLISSTVLNLGLNGQKYALRKHDERRIQKEMEMEEEHERWRQLGWTEEQVEQEADRLYEIKENRRGPLYRKLKPYMFWRAIFVSKLWAAGLLVFIVGNLGGFVALRFAPQSLTAPLGSIALISNVIIAPLINKEVLGKWDLAGIFFIVVGSVIVVVFSGIVAQDYKLCVLINLFHKPATIAYLSLIGFCIIFIFFFIKFVEKNVENEDDMAIGVSAEQQLKQEGRLHRMNSNMSNLSLRQSLPPRPSTTSAINTNGQSVDAPAPDVNDADALGAPLEMPVRPFATRLPVQSMTSDMSHQTGLSDVDDTTAVGTSSACGGTERQGRNSFSSADMRSVGDQSSIHSSRISLASLDIHASPSTIIPRKNTPGRDLANAPRLTFDESGPPRSTLEDTRSPSIAAEEKNVATATMDAEPARPSLGGRSGSMATSVHSTSRAARRRRQRLQRQPHPPQPDGTNTDAPLAPSSLWTRIRQFEFIPALPEDKLIRRDSPLLRFCLPLSYAALGGMMASYTVLFAKSLINLLVTSVFDGDNQFTSGLAWVILVVTVVTAVSQVYWINMGLKKYDALLQVPVFFTIWVLLDIVGGGIYYGEFSGFTAKKYVLFCLGVLVVFLGVALLAKRLAVLAKEDVGEGSQSASAPVSRRQSMVVAKSHGKNKDDVHVAAGSPL